MTRLLDDGVTPRRHRGSEAQVCSEGLGGGFHRRAKVDVPDSRWAVSWNPVCVSQVDRDGAEAMTPRPCPAPSLQFFMNDESSGRARVCDGPGLVTSNAHRGSASAASDAIGPASRPHEIPHLPE